MTHTIALPIAAAVLSGLTGLAALLLATRSPVYVLLALGMGLLAGEKVFTVYSLGSAIPSDVIEWETWRFAVSTLAYSPFLLFSSRFAREKSEGGAGRWMVPALAPPAAVAVLLLFFRDSIFPAARSVAGLGPFWQLSVGTPGYAAHVLALLCSVAILVSLERLLRASFGDQRWRVKFTLLGVGAVFAFRIYTTADVLLYSAVNTHLVYLESLVQVLALPLVLLSILRQKDQPVTIHVSQDLVRYSLTVVIVGLYLIAVGVLAKVAVYFGAAEGFVQNAFLVFVAFLGITAILLSDQIRNETRRFAHRHFRAPLHDYRKVWAALTERTSSVLNTADLCRAVARTVSETFGVSAVSIWLADDQRGPPVLGGSTALGAGRPEALEPMEREIAFLMMSLRGKTEPVDLRRPGQGAAVSKPTGGADGEPPETLIRTCVPLAMGGELLGLMTLNERMTGEDFSIEDLDLLKTMGDQTAGMLLNLKLFENLAHARELEALQTLSAFFVHDLKNLTNTLSLTLQNLPVHFDNPEFRADAFRVIGSTVEKMQGLCSRLSLFRKGIEVHKRPCDLNRLVESVLAGVGAGNGGNAIDRELNPLPEAPLDPEQMEKVLLNLVLNAREASPPGGTVRVVTGRREDSVFVAVSDDGCGMSREFMARELFKPFKTTKKRGLGIGLYHSRMIVEAHKGRIEVESVEGKGSTFRVVVPLK
jgi:putative PEP-CTERM system histidine kinase